MFTNFRKTFKDSLLKTFPNLSENELNDFLPKKEVLNIIKVVTSDDVTVQVYTVRKRPMAFEAMGRLFPTVYFLWKFPNVIYAFTTHQKVMQFIGSGADLMLPGVVTPASQLGLLKFGHVSENDSVYVNLTNNIAAVAVGVASQSSGSMMLANGRGKCVIIRHFYGDYLCVLDGMPILPIVNLGPPEWLKFKSYEEDFPELGANPKTLEDTVEVSEIKVEITTVDDALFTDTNPPESPSEIIEDMDEILYYCFLGAIKYSKVILPVLTSNFFKLHMLPLCPETQILDIKKTSFKKLKPFLEKMDEV